MGRLRDAWREAWETADRSLPGPLKSSARYQVMGPDVVEERGIEKHHPVRPPEKWKKVIIFGKQVYVNGHGAATGLRECPGCAALIVDDPWAKQVHERVCPGLAAQLLEVMEESEA